MTSVTRPLRRGVLSPAESGPTGRPAMVERHGRSAAEHFTPEDVHVQAVP